MPLHTFKSRSGQVISENSRICWKESVFLNQAGRSPGLYWSETTWPPLFLPGIKRRNCGQRLPFHSGKPLIGINGPIFWRPFKIPPPWKMQRGGWTLHWTCSTGKNAALEFISVGTGRVGTSPIRKISYGKYPYSAFFQACLDWSSKDIRQGIRLVQAALQLGGHIWHLICIVPRKR